MVGPRFKRNLSFIKTLIKTKSDENRKKILANASEDEIFALMDAGYNVLRFNFPLKPSQRRKLATRAKLLRSLSKKRNAESGRRILQSGDGGMFIALLAPVVAEVARHLISAIKND